MSGDIILVIVIATALAFDFTNGFHDTANVVATRDLHPCDRAKTGGRDRRVA